MSNSVERFSTRVDNYVRYRPGYPLEIIETLKTECGLTPESVIADLGSGTGKLAKLFLENGNTVFGVEPNAGMREAAEAFLKDSENFRSVSGTAESTLLPSGSVDFVTAGQAFHWFDPAEAKTECTRILKSGGWAVLVWNERLVDGTPFLRDYEALLLHYSIDYPVVRHENAENAIAEFFAPQAPTLAIFANTQKFDFEGLKGRVLSSSYTPETGHPKFEPMLSELREIFDRHQQSGKVNFDYDTKLYYGPLGIAKLRDCEIAKLFS